MKTCGRRRRPVAERKSPVAEDETCGRKNGPNKNHVAEERAMCGRKKETCSRSNGFVAETTVAFHVDCGLITEDCVFSHGLWLDWRGLRVLWHEQRVLWLLCKLQKNKACHRRINL